jgi:SH3-like domain-containing protein
MHLGVLAFVVVVSFHANASAPVFVSLKSSEVNLRVGPGKEYPVSWTFLRANLPVMLMSEFDQWNKIRFVDETEGWVHKNMISRKNTAIIISEYAVLYKYASDTHPIAKIEKNVVLEVKKKDGEWIKVVVNKIEGWVKKENLWGVKED